MRGLNAQRTHAVRQLFDIKKNPKVHVFAKFAEPKERRNKKKCS